MSGEDRWGRVLLLLPLAVMAALVLVRAAPAWTGETVRGEVITWAPGHGRDDDVGVLTLAADQGGRRALRVRTNTPPSAGARVAVCLPAGAGEPSFLRVALWGPCRLHQAASGVFGVLLALLAAATFWEGEAMRLPGVARAQRLAREGRALGDVDGDAADPKPAATRARRDG